MALRCLPEDPRIEQIVDRDLPAQCHEPRAAVVGMARQLVGGQAESAVPRGRARESGREFFDPRAAIARIQDQRIDIPVQPHRAVDLCLNVVVEFIDVGRKRERDQPMRSATPKCVGSSLLSG